MFNDAIRCMHARIQKQFNDSYNDETRRWTAHGGVATGGNWSVLVVDSHRLRRVTFPAAYAHIFWGKQAMFRGELNETTTLGVSKFNGIESSGMVLTVAGQRTEGIKDGQGSEVTSPF